MPDSYIYAYIGDDCICMYGRHVLSSLNKLDAGDPEEILLSSRDGKDLLVVTFADVRRWAPHGADSRIRLALSRCLSAAGVWRSRSST